MSNQAIEWQEHVLAQLQSGAISVEEAEQLLAGPGKYSQVAAESLEEPIDIASYGSDVAIIGMSCRFPGARSWQELWENLKNGVDSVTEVPKGRWHEGGWFDANPKRADTSYSKWGGFLEGVALFDAHFFDISPAEAKIMDPQQRIFLEEAYHAIENAGYATDSLRGQKCGVFVGATESNYANLLSSAGLETSRFTVTGLGPSFLAARIAYFLDLQGPAISIDAACSSSLVAVHQACESIRSGEVDLALAGGVTLLLTPLPHIRTSQFQMLSPAGRCKTFDESANGIVLAEGCGVLFLKNAAQAISDNDPIVAIIKGSGVNQDGSTNGITAPSVKSQTRLIKTVYERFEIDPLSIGYVEAHGTGTSLGDPIEIAALTDAFSHLTRQAGVTSKKQFCAIGSLKSNIGHTLLTAGVAGLIKAALCLQYGELVPSLHFKRPNPRIDFENSPFYVNTSHQKWPSERAMPRRAAVSSFGLSGTNAHAILECAPKRSRTLRKSQPALHLLTLSAKTKGALNELVARYESYLATESVERCPEPVEGLADPSYLGTSICFTANTGRADFAHRLSVVGSSSQEMAQKLAAVQAGEEPLGLWQGHVKGAAHNSRLPDGSQNDSALAARAECSSLLSSMGQLYVRGGEIDWKAFYQDDAQKVVLPTYPFQRERYWVEPIMARRRKISRSSSPEHPLLQERLYSAALKKGEVQFEAQLSATSPAYLADHRVFGQTILPASAYFEMALAAGSQLLPGVSITLEDVLIEKALRLDEPQTVQLLLTPDERGYSWQIFSLAMANEEPAWTRHAAGQACREGRGSGVAEEPRNALSLQTLQARLSEDQESSATSPVSTSFYRQTEKLTHPENGPHPLPPLPTLGEGRIPIRSPLSQSWERGLGGEGQDLMCDFFPLAFYQQFAQQQIVYGESFQGVRRLWRGKGEALGQVELAEHLHEKPYQWHPALLDACFQVLAAALPKEDLQKTYLPVGCQRFTLWTSPKDTGGLNGRREVFSYVQVRPSQKNNTISADFQLIAPDGQVCAEIVGFQLQKVRHQAVVGKEPWRDWLYDVAWREAGNANGTPLDVATGGDWLILAERTGVGRTLADQLNARGMGTRLVYEPADWEPLLARGEYQGVLYLWGLNTCDSDDNDNEEGAFVESCGQVLHLVQALIKSKSTPRLWLVTKGAQSVLGAQEVNPVDPWQTPLWGLGKVIALEHPELKTVCLDLPPDILTRPLVDALRHELLAPDAENLIAYRNGVRYVARLEHYRQMEAPTGPFAVKLTSYGTLENLSLLPIADKPLAPEEVEIDVRASGLNFRDVLRALGMMREVEEAYGIKSAAEISFGFECAGVIKRVGKMVSGFKVGDAVIAFTRGTLASVVTTSAKFVVPKPPEMSFTEAATIPVTFLTAYYGLVTCAQLGPTDRVLIHAAAGGVGQAAVQLAQRAGAEVFATASPAKWDFLRSQGIKHIANSRTVEFAKQLMTLTDGEGVDVVLNSLNGEFIDKSFDVLGKGGRFVEIGKLGIWDEQTVQALRPDVTYFPFDLSQIEPQQISSMLLEVMDMFREGTLTPLPKKAFPITDVVSAFRTMQQAKHIGKVVLTVPSPLELGGTEGGRGSYLITGGLGALGLKVARWLVEQGAQHLVLMGRSGAKPAAKKVIEHLEQAGANISLIRADVSNREEVKKVLAACPNLRGIVHAAGVLDDGVLMQQSLRRFERVMAPKVQGAWNLHLETREMPLDFFVLFSSVASLLGSPGQANYAAANAFMDGLAHYRSGYGLPALSINWGPWADAGMAADLASRLILKGQGVEMIAPEDGLQVLGMLLQAPAVQVGVLPLKAHLTAYRDLPLFEALTPHSQPEKTSDFLKQVQSAPINKRRRLLKSHLREQVGKVLGLSSLSHTSSVSTSLEAHKGLFELGIDSLMAIELKNRLEKSLACTLPATLLFDFPTLDALEAHLAEELELVELVEESQADSVPFGTPSTPKPLNNLSQQEIANLLAKKLAAIKRA